MKINLSSSLIFTKQVQTNVLKIAETRNLSTETHFYLLKCSRTKITLCHIYNGYETLKVSVDDRGKLISIIIIADRECVSVKIQVILIFCSSLTLVEV